MRERGEERTAGVSESLIDRGHPTPPPDRREPPGPPDPPRFAPAPAPPFGTLTAVTPTNPPPADAAPVTAAARVRGLLTAAARPWVWALAVSGAALPLLPPEDGDALLFTADEASRADRPPVLRRAVTVAAVPGDDAGPGWLEDSWHTVAVRVFWYGHRLGGSYDRDWLTDDQARSLNLPNVGIAFARGNDHYWSDVYFLRDSVRDPLYEAVYDSAFGVVSPLLAIGPLLLASVGLVARRLRREPGAVTRTTLLRRRLVRPWVAGAAIFALAAICTAPWDGGAECTVRATTFPAAGWRPFGVWDRTVTAEWDGEAVDFEPGDGAGVADLDDGFREPLPGVSLWNGWTGGGAMHGGTWKNRTA